MNKKKIKLLSPMHVIVFFFTIFCSHDVIFPMKMLDPNKNVFDQAINAYTKDIRKAKITAATARADFDDKKIAEDAYKKSIREAKITAATARADFDDFLTKNSTNPFVKEYQQKEREKKAQTTTTTPQPPAQVKIAETKAAKPVAVAQADPKAQANQKLLALIDETVRFKEVITDTPDELVKRIAEKSVDSTYIPDTLVLVENTAVSRKRSADEALKEAYGYIETIQPNAKRLKLETTGTAVIETRKEAEKALTELEKGAAK